MNTQNNQKTQKCLVDKKEYPVNQGQFLSRINPTIVGHIRNDHKDVNDNSFICDHHLLEYQIDYINRLINNDDKQNQKIEDKLTKSMSKSNYKIQNINDDLNESETFGQKLSDYVAKFGGTWTFITIFLLFLFLWMFINVYHLFGAHFDDYPFILLNLALSIMAAIQSPIIMMSQNRSNHHDRLEADNDYHVNLKSESELRSLHAKLDHISQGQLPDNMDTQKMQIAILGEIREELDTLQNDRARMEAILNRLDKKIK